MSMKNPLILVVGLSVLAACNESENIRSCRSMDFVPKCVTSTTYTACKDNVEVIKSCSGSAFCNNGQCLLDEDCNPEKYTPTCLDDDHISACNASGKVEPMDCEGKVCAVLYDKAKCYDLCTEEEVAAGQQSSCENAKDLPEDVELGYYTETSCVEFKGTFIKDIRTKDCYHWCDRETNQCRYIHPDEGKKCDPQKDQSYCSKGSGLVCGWVDSDPRRYEWRAFSCDMWDADCVEIKDNQGIIQPTCMYLCDPEYHEEFRSCQHNQVHYWDCSPSKGGYYEESSVYETCNHGCNEEGTDCVILHEDEGKDCGVDNGNGLEPGSPRCDGSILLTCTKDSKSSFSKTFYSYLVKDCTDGGEYPSYTCDPTYGCYDPCSTVGEFKACEGEKLYTGECVEDPTSHVKHVTNKHTKYCDHGCDVNTKSCILLHEDENKECSDDESDDNYYPSKCVNNLLLECKYGTVHVKECGSLACNASFGCYHACDTIGEKGSLCYENKSYDTECTEDEETKVKYFKKLMSYTICAKECDKTTGECKH